MSVLEDIFVGAVQLVAGDDPALIDVIHICAILRWFDAEIITQLLPAEQSGQAEELFERLKKLPFIEEYSIRGYTFGDYLQNYLLKEKALRLSRKEMRSRAAQAYHKLLDKLPKRAEEWIKSQEWNVIAAEWLYHLAWIEPGRAIAELERIFAEAFAVLITGNQEVEFCNELFNRIGFEQIDWRPNSPFPDRIAYLKQKLQPLLANQDKEALDLLEELAETPGLKAEQKASLYQWIGSTLFREANQPARGRKMLELAHSLAPNDMQINAELSSFHSISGVLWSRIDLAQHYGEQTVKAGPQNDRGYTELGFISQMLSDWDEALSWYKKALEVDPESIDALLGLSEVYAARRRPADQNEPAELSDLERALRLINEAESVSPSIRYYTLVRKGNAYLSSLRFEEARQSYVTARSEDPDQPDAYNALGILQIHQLQSRLAKENLRLAIAKDPSWPDSYLELADMYEVQEKFDRALQVYEQALDAGIRSVSLLSMMNNLLGRMCRWSDLQAAWERWLAETPDLAYLAACLQGDAYLAWAREMRSIEETQAHCRQAAEHYQKASALDGGLPAAHIGLAEVALLTEDSASLANHKFFIEDQTPWAAYDLLVQLGRDELSLSRYTQAEEYFNRALSMSPQRSEARVALADLYEEKSDTEALVQTWADLQRLDTQYTFRGGIDVGTYFLGLGDYDRARAEYSRVAEQYPDLAEPDFRLANLASEEGKPDTAIRLYRQAKEKGPDYGPAALDAISEILLKENKSDQAEKAAREAILEDPESLFGYVALTRIGIKLKKRKYVEEARKKLGETRPDLIPNLEYAAAEFYREAGRLALAQKAYLHSLEESEAWGKPKGPSYHGLALVLVKAKKFAQADEQFQRALEQLGPLDDYSASLSMGQEYESAGRLSKAEEYFRKAIEWIPQRPNGYLYLASILRAQGKKESAREAYIQAESLADIGFLALGRFYEGIERLKDAIECYFLGIESITENEKPDLYYALGKLHIVMKNFELGEEELLKAIELEPEWFEPYVDLMQHFFDQDQFDKVHEIRDRMAAYPNLAWIGHLYMGRFLSMKEDLQAAEKSYREALAADPDQIDIYWEMVDFLLNNERFDDAVQLLQEMGTNEKFAYNARITLADLLMRKDDYRGAEKPLQEAVQLEPENLDGYHILADLYWYLGRTDDAERCLLQALAIETEDFEATVKLAQVHQKQRRNEEALQLFRKATTLSAEDSALSDAYTQIGLLELQLGSMEEAIEPLLQAISYNRSNETAFFYLGQIYEQIEDYKNAEIMYSRLLEINPKNGDAYHGLGRVYGKLRKPKKAARIEREILALELEPQELIDAMQVIAECYAEAGASEQAIDAFNRWIEKDPDNALAYSELASWLEEWQRPEEAISVFDRMKTRPGLLFQAQLLSGELLQRLERYQEAEYAYRKAIKADPTKAEAYIELCELLLDLESVDDALKLVTAMEQQPSLVENAIFSRAAIFLRTDQLSEAESTYLDAVLRDPNRADAYIGLAETYRRKGELDKAESNLLKAVEIDPEYFEANQMLEQLFDSQGKIQEALQYKRRVAELDPDLGSAASRLKELGEEHLKRGEFGKAVEVLVDAVQISPQDDDLVYSLGMALELNQELNLAVEMYERATRLNPRHGPAYVALGRVYGILKQVQGVHEIARKINQMELDPAEQYDARIVIAEAYRIGNFLEWAIEEYERAIEQEPKRGEAYAGLGRVYEQQGRPASAIEAYQRAISLSSEYEADLRLSIGACYLTEVSERQPGDEIRQSGEEKAEAEFLRSLELEPSQAEGYHWLAQLYESQKRWEDAIKIYSQMIANVRDLASSGWISIATIHRRLGERKTLEEDLQKALSLEPDKDSPEYVNMLRRKGLSHFMLGEYQPAETNLLQALEYNPQDCYAHFYRALNLLCLGRREEAQSELQTGIKLATTKADYTYAIEEAEALAGQIPPISGAAEMLLELRTAQEKLNSE